MFYLIPSDVRASVYHNPTRCHSVLLACQSVPIQSPFPAFRSQRRCIKSLPRTSDYDHDGHTLPPPPFFLAAEPRQQSIPYHDLETNDSKDTDAKRAEAGSLASLPIVILGSSCAQCPASCLYFVSSTASNPCLLTHFYCACGGPASSYFLSPRLSFRWFWNPSAQTPEMNDVALPL